MSDLLSISFYYGIKNSYIINIANAIDLTTKDGVQTVNTVNPVLVFSAAIIINYISVLYMYFKFNFIWYGAIMFLLSVKTGQYELQ